MFKTLPVKTVLQNDNSVPRKLRIVLSKLTVVIAS